MKLSVIIPTRNRAALLNNALRCIVNQTLAKNVFEVIVVDNGSLDHTKAVVTDFEKLITNLHYIYDPNPGLHIGRHRGLLASNSDILVYADDDIEAFPTWLEAISDTFQDQNVALVGGNNIPKFEASPPSWINEQWNLSGPRKVIAELSILDFGEEQTEISPLYVFGCNFSIRKRILIEAGGFHPDGMPTELIKYRGDGETSVARYVHKNNYKTVFNPKASVFHIVSKQRLTLAYFAQQNYKAAISSSYTAVRENKPTRLFKKRIKIFIKKYLLLKNTEIEEAFIKGYIYHQTQTKSDTKLYDWIMRESYIENGIIN